MRRPRFTAFRGPLMSMSAGALMGSLLVLGAHPTVAFTQCGSRGHGCHAARTVQIGLDANYPFPYPAKYVSQTEAPGIAANGFVLVRVSASSTAAASPTSTNPGCVANDPTIGDFS